MPRFFQYTLSDQRCINFCDSLFFSVTLDKKCNFHENWFKFYRLVSKGTVRGLLEFFKSSSYGYDNFYLPLLTNATRNPWSLFQWDLGTRKILLGIFSISRNFRNLISKTLRRISFWTLIRIISNTSSTIFVSPMEFWKWNSNISNRRFVSIQISQDDREYRLKGAICGALGSLNHPRSNDDFYRLIRVIRNRRCPRF